MEKLTYFDGAGNAIMLNVSEKNITERVAPASCKIIVSAEIFNVIKSFRNYSAVPSQLLIAQLI